MRILVASGAHACERRDDIGARYAHPLGGSAMRGTQSLALELNEANVESYQNA